MEPVEESKDKPVGRLGEIEKIASETGLPLASTKLGAEIEELEELYGVSSV